MKEKVFLYGEDRLSAGYALEIAHGQRRGLIGERASARIAASEEIVRDIVSKDTTVYGINTGFGPLCTTTISADETRELQHNLLKSHSSGIGDALPADISKIMMILKVHALAQGFSGIRRQTLDRMLLLIENDVVPVVPTQGSVGASGDLAPLAHLFLPLIGLGEVEFKGRVMTAEGALNQLSLKPLNLGPKEGLALINGTQFIAANALKGLQRFKSCLDQADIMGAMSIEALLGSQKPFNEQLHTLRAYKGNCFVAGHLRLLLKDSQINQSHQHCSSVQDPYSLRCMPQVHGASRNAWLNLKESLDIEMNSVTDNPIILDRENAISGGHFHGQPIALPIDYASLGVAELGSISERRVYFLMEGKREGLPKFLIDHSGLHSGLMIPQYTAASLVSENKTMCFPASADSIPTSIGQEDHVSMGSIGSRKFHKMLDNIEKILAIELLCASQGMEFRKPLKSSVILEACHREIRKHISYIHEDRIFAQDMANALELVKNSTLIHVAKQAIEEHALAVDIPYESDFSLY
ncbi:MAG: histidine ammonia-lyase [Acidobacteria bacterium]|nr:MAG: histidine ammonia-lyase [Acidobacteriota bacterium]